MSRPLFKSLGQARQGEREIGAVISQSGNLRHDKEGVLAEVDLKNIHYTQYKERWDHKCQPSAPS